MSQVSLDIVSKYSDKGASQAERALKSLTQATDRVSAARDKEANASGKVRVAEAKLTELRERGGAKASQLAAAEERLAAAKRGLTTAHGRATSSVKQYDQAQRRAAAANDATTASLKKVDSELDQTESKFKDFSEFMSANLGKAAGLGVGLLAGGGFVAGFQDALQQGQDRAKLQAQLGLSDKDAAKAAKISGKLYADNFGESVSAVNDTIRKIVQDTDVGIRNINLEPLTAKIVTVTETFEQETGQVTRAAGQLVRTGLAKNVNQAIDIITAGFQKGADKSEDFLDTFNEYGTLFRNMGLSGQKATGILVQGLQAGARDADKVADAIKEFSIRAVDGSELTAQGFKMIGLNADSMAEKIGKGGGSASRALDKVLDRLGDIEDPVKRSQAAVALFGTQAEDLGEALFALDPSEAARKLGKFAGSAQRAVDTVGSTPQATIQSFIRTLKQGLVDGLAAAIEAFQTGRSEGEGFLLFMSQVGVVAKRIAGAVGAVAKVFAGLPRPIQTAVLAMGAFLLLRSKFAGFSQAISTNIIAPFRDAPSAIGGFKGALVSTGKMMLKGGLWGIAIAVAGGALSWLFGKFFEAKERVDELTQALEADSGAIRRNTKAALAKQLVDAGMIEKARAAGVSFDLTTRAALGSAEAMGDLGGALEVSNARVKRAADRINEMTRAHKLVAPEQRRHLERLISQRDALQKLIGSVGTMRDDLYKSKSAYADTKRAQDAVTNAFKGGTSALDKANRSVKNALGLETDQRRKLINLVDAANKQTRAMKDNGVAQDKVRDRMELARAEFVRIATKMDIAKDRAIDLSKKLINLRGKYEAKILADTRPAERVISRFIETQSGRKINLNVDGFGSGTPGIATGGAIRGPGSGTSDTAGVFRLSNGEHVLTASDVRKMGGQSAVYRLREMAQAGKLRGFAKGGPVTLDVRPSGLDALREKITQALSVPAVSGVPSSVSGNAAIVKSIFSQMFGWARYWPQTYSLLMKESGFRNTAQNPTSSAYGMFQFLDSTWGGYGIPKTSDPRLQTIAGGRYIRARYGNPASALAFHLRNNWYDKGGILKSGGIAGNKSGKPERILSPRQTNAFERLVDALTGGLKQSDDPLSKQLKSLHRTITGIARLLHKADRHRTAERVGQGFRRRIANLLKRRERLDDRLEKAISRRDRIVERRRAVSGGLRSSIFEGRNLVGGFGIDIDGGFSAGDLAKQLGANLADAKKFQGLLQTLRKKGFSKAIIAQIAEAGVTEGMSAAVALADAQKGQVGQINKTFGQIGATAVKFSKQIGHQLFGAGQKAAQGLIDGLRKKRKQIQSTMNDIAKSLIRAIRKALKIKSPSQEMFAVGELVGKGLEGGLMKSLPRSIMAMENAADGVKGAFVPRRPARPISQRGGGDIHIHVHGARDADDIVRRLRHELKTNRTLRRELGLAK